MRLYTRQSALAWELLQKRGVLRCDGRRVDPFFRPAYRWMREEMLARLGPPPAPVLYPIWAWYRYDDKRRCNPASAADNPVLLQIEIPDDQVLLSNFDSWHCVLNGFYFARTEREERRFERSYEAAGLTPQNVQTDPDFGRAIRESWRLIFQPRLRTIHTSSPFCIQATFWELRLDQVRRTWWVKGRPLPKYRQAAKTKRSR
jgi:hypothetical protein